MLRSILVPLDGSSFGEHALPLALALARRAGAVLHMVHVHHIVPPTTIAGVAVMDTVDLHLRQDEQAYLADVSRRVKDTGPVEYHSVLVEGDVSAALYHYATHNRIDAVVMSTHGRGTMGRFWLGSVADDLIREMPLPVILIRPGEGKADLHQNRVLKNILVPLNGTEEAEQVLESAAALAKLFEAQLTLVQVNKPVIRPSYLPEGASMLGMTQSVLDQIEHLQKTHQEQAQSYLDGIAKQLRDGGCKVQTRVDVDEEPAVGILLEARAQHADLIAVETHGRTGIPRLILGSVADKIIHGADVPVLVHRRRV